MKILILSFLVFTTWALLSGCAPKENKSYSRLSNPAKIEISEKPSTKRNTRFVPIFRYDFGTVPSLKPLVTVFTLQNTGENPASHLSFAIDSKAYHIGNYCGSMLPPFGKGTCQIIITFSPYRDGNFPAILTVSYENGKNQPQSYKFLVNGNSTQKYSPQPSSTPSETSSPSSTPSETPSPSPTPSETPSPSPTPTPTPCPTPTPSPTSTIPAACGSTDKISLPKEQGLLAIFDACPIPAMGDNACKDWIIGVSDFDTLPKLVTKDIARIYFNNFDLIDKTASEGFPLADGTGKLKDKTSGKLYVDYFRFNIYGFIKLTESDDPDLTYYFKVISDDGSKLYLTSNENDISGINNNTPKIAPQGLPAGMPVTNYYLALNNDGIHSAWWQDIISLPPLNPKEPRFSVNSGNVGVTFQSKDTPLPYILKYFQGMGPGISLAWYWSTTKPVDQRVEDMSDWTIIPARNFWLPNGDNPCNL